MLDPTQIASVLALRATLVASIASIDALLITENIEGQEAETVEQALCTHVNREPLSIVGGAPGVGFECVDCGKIIVER